MCVLIFKPKGEKLPSKKIIKACCQANPHGFGFATMRGVLYKTLDRNDFIDKLYSVVGVEDDVMIHCRLATHGSICEANCHPFEIDGVYFAHNGILNIEPIGDKTDSETAFVKYIYPAVKRYGLQSDETTYLVMSLIGSSKFCIFDTEKMTIRLFGAYEKMGGVYYSNTRFLYYMRPNKRACYNNII